MGFSPAWQKGGVGSPNPNVYQIASATAIEKGEMVKLSAGLVVAIGDVDQDDPHLGVAAENHDGATADGRQTGTEILIYDDPNTVFKIKPRDPLTATGGSTTTFVDSSVLPETADIFNGGALILVSVAANSALNGKKVNISDFDGANGTFTLSETLSDAIAAGDTAYLIPGKRCKGHYAWNLTADGTDIDFDNTAAGEAIYVEDVDVDNGLLYVSFRLHQRGNHPAAL